MWVDLDSYQSYHKKKEMKGKKRKKIISFNMVVENIIANNSMQTIKRCNEEM